MLDDLHRDLQARGVLAEVVQAHRAGRTGQGPAEVPHGGTPHPAASPKDPQLSQGGELPAPGATPEPSGAAPRSEGPPEEGNGNPKSGRKPSGGAARQAAVRAAKPELDKAVANFKQQHAGKAKGVKGAPDPQVVADAVPIVQALAKPGAATPSSSPGSWRNSSRGSQRSSTRTWCVRTPRRPGEEPQEVARRRSPHRGQTSARPARPGFGYRRAQAAGVTEDSLLAELYKHPLGAVRDNLADVLEALRPGKKYDDNARLALRLQADQFFSKTHKETAATEQTALKSYQEWLKVLK